MPRRFATAVPVWIVALIGSVGAFVVNEAQPWPATLSIVLGACLILTFGIQLALQRKKGLVNRMAFTTTGVLIIVGVAMITAVLVHGVTILDWSWEGVG